MPRNRRPPRQPHQGPEFANNDAGVPPEFQDGLHNGAPANLGQQRRADEDDSPSPPPQHQNEEPPRRVLRLSRQRRDRIYAANIAVRQQRVAERQQQQQRPQRPFAIRALNGLPMEINAPPSPPPQNENEHAE
ncbi:hypothetical protein DAPPUDRAFT_112092 [Daphnia pulex]|uniref:Uncharacterized protein n=1 Tax=Daphnia pulex TaxID=6669 RepID=E9HAX9_DAPPU|nr:hypothetical protein DAPPUDRAFT_112092 [Daphnia pulex]|eukprot:EFX71111.1 hypothetical protein DAPPUDRAFT_112092 [Daphnia pulex]